MNSRYDVEMIINSRHTVQPVDLTTKINYKQQVVLQHWQLTLTITADHLHVQHFDLCHFQFLL
jgi:hypothetical protein